MASDQFERVRPGDRVWAVGVEDGELLTIGYIDAGPVLSMEEARQRVDYEPWEAAYHVIVDRGERARRVSLAAIARDLRFDSATSPRLTPSARGAVNAQQLQRIRRLTPESAALLERVWTDGVARQRDEYAEIESALDALGELDARREVLVRREQELLRQTLIGAEGEGTCILCGRDLPVTLLVAAHIKPRSRCTDAERRDFSNNVAAMCLLGCDALFERGFIIVSAGKVAEGPRLRSAGAAARAAADELLGKPCRFWSAGSAPYFDWHARDHRANPARG